MFTFLGVVRLAFVFVAEIAGLMVLGSELASNIARLIILENRAQTCIFTMWYALADQISGLNLGIVLESNCCLQVALKAMVTLHHYQNLNTSRDRVQTSIVASWYVLRSRSASMLDLEFACLGGVIVVLSACHPQGSDSCADQT